MLGGANACLQVVIERICRISQSHRGRARAGRRWRL